MGTSTSTTVSILGGFARTMLDIVYPIHCVLCGEFGQTYLCERCAADIPEPLLEPLCERCGHPAGGSLCDECRRDPPAFERCVCIGDYTGNLQEAIHWLKYRDRPMLAEPLSKLLAVHAAQKRTSLNQLAFDAVVPVPMHPMRARLRGYNHAECLAQGFARHTGLCVRTDLLYRARRTKSQVGLTGQTRRANLRGAFRASEEVSGRTLLLIDDVSTTGATLRECAKSLKDAEAKSVYCLTLVAG